MTAETFSAWTDTDLPKGRIKHSVFFLYQNTACMYLPKIDQHVCTELLTSSLHNFFYVNAESIHVSKKDSKVIFINNLSTVIS